MTLCRARDVRTRREEQILGPVVVGSRMTVDWEARDALNMVETADYSLDLERPAPGEHTIAARLADEYENPQVEKVAVRN